MALAVLLPAGIVLGWLAIPDQSPVKLLQAPSPALLPETIKSKDAINYSMTIRSNKENTQWQLEWKNKAMLMVPSAVIYKMPERVTSATFKPEQAELIGRIETKGSYLFPLPDDSSGYKHINLVLYDFIHGKTIETIHL
jgi:hypothetical protein